MLDGETMLNGERLKWYWWGSQRNSIDRNEKRTGPRVLYHLIYVLLSFRMVVGSMDVYQTMQALIKYDEKRVLVMRKLVSTEESFC